MNSAEDFTKWALDPDRTVDELCAIELFLHWGRVVWGWKHNNQVIPDWQALQAEKKERSSNPAYRPKIDRELLAQTVEVAEQIDKWPASNYDDRPIRALSLVRFFPNLQEVAVDVAEVADLAPLGTLKKLRQLRLREPFGIGGYVITELSGIAGLPALEDVHLNLRAPWPDLTALATLPALQKLYFMGNLLALAEIKALPALQVGDFAQDFHWKTPLRSLESLPEMPHIQRLVLPGVADLKGAERMPELRNLDLSGPFADLTPLSALKQLTFLKLQGERFADLAPLAQLPNLRQIVLVRERPLDVAPLAESVSLREVKVEGCPIIATELAALNAGLLPWGPDFLAETPRPLSPLRIFVYRPGDEEIKQLRLAPTLPDPRLDAYAGDEALAMAEAHWFVRELNQRLDALLGKGWTDRDDAYVSGAGHHHLTIKRFRDVARIGEIFEKCRALMAACRYPWRFLVSVEPHGDISDDIEAIRSSEGEVTKPWWDQEYDAEQEREDHEEMKRSRRELYERFEREHRMRLLEQQGTPIDPKEFSPSAPKPPPKTAVQADDFADDDDDDEDDFDFDDEDEDLLEPEDDTNSELAEDLSFVVTLEENYLWISEHMRDNAEYTLGVKAVDWHQLPEPLEQRPRPI